MILTEAVIDREDEYAENQTNRRDDGQSSAAFSDECAASSAESSTTSSECLIEVTLFVRIRIEEETLGATFHGGKLFTLMSEFERFLQNATGLFED